MSSGSPDLRRLYLDPESAGVPWLLDPDDATVEHVLSTYEERTPADPCDPEALARDLDDALVLIRARHIGIAEGEFASPTMDAALDAWAHEWHARLVAEQPKTWGEALGLDGYRLRRILGDSHCNLRGEDPQLLASADPRRHAPRLDDPGPAAEVTDHGDVLAVRVRRLGGSPEQVARLKVTSWTLLVAGALAVGSATLGLLQ